MSLPPPLTKRQAEILQLHINGIEENGYPPTRREILERLGFSSLNNITEHIFRIQKKGYIKLAGKAKGRAMRVLLYPDGTPYIYPAVRAEQARQLAPVNLPPTLRTIKGTWLKQIELKNCRDAG
jgi:repressor LexA